MTFRVMAVKAGQRGVPGGGIRYLKKMATNLPVCTSGDDDWN